MNSDLPPSTPHAHPPSPRQLRAAATPIARSAHRSTPTTRTSSNSNYLLRHWRGELHLALAVMLSGALIWCGVQLLAFLGRRFPITDYPEPAAALWLIEISLLMLGALWWGRGVQKSAMRHMEQGGSGLVALTAGITGLAAFFWVGAFWWLSARHLAPEVWATLTGALPPATVSVVAPREVLVSGDLEFGSARALRRALEANPQVQRVHLESRGGRVKEGLAMGLLIRDRNLDTLVVQECSSACVTAFAGGARRLINADTRLGLHSAGGAGANAEGIAQANHESDSFIAGRGVDRHVLEKGAAVENNSIWFPPAYVLLASGLATHYAHEVPDPR